MSDRFRETFDTQAVRAADAVVLETVIFALIGSIRAFGFSRSRFRQLLAEGSADLEAIDPDGTLRAEVIATGDGVLKLLGRQIGPDVPVEDLPPVEAEAPSGAEAPSRRVLGFPRLR